VVAERDRVGAELQQLARRLLCDAYPAGRIFAVDHDEVGLVLVAQAGEQRGQRPPPEASHHIAYEEELHGGRFCQGDPNGAAGRSAP